MRSILRARRLLVSGMVVAALGYLLLLATDRMGRNWASHLAPLLIIAGIGLAAADLTRKE